MAIGNDVLFLLGLAGIIYCNVTVGANRILDFLSLFITITCFYLHFLATRKVFQYLAQVRIKKELRRMKGKRACKERILVFMLIFDMVVGMVMEPVQLQAAVVEGEPVQEEIVTEEQPPAEKEYEVKITAPEGPFYIGETYEDPFKTTVWNKTDGYEVIDPKLVWSCTENATIDTNTGVLSILKTAIENEKISITAKLIDENATSILSEDTYEISVSVRPQYSITGKVIDQYDKEGIAGATVTLNPTEGSKGQQVTTDTLADGIFTMQNVVGGTNTDYTLTVTKDGYTSYEYNNESFQNAENAISLSEGISLDFAEEIQLSQSNLDLKVGETKAIEIIWPEHFLDEWKDKNEVEVSATSDAVTAVVQDSQLLITGNKEVSEVQVTVNAHGKSATVENINVKKYAISGEITIEPKSVESDQSYHAKDVVNIKAEFKADGVPMDGEGVTFSITHLGIDPEETEATLTDGAATLNDFEFKYAGVYKITCTLPESNKYNNDACTITKEVCVEALGEEYQSIDEIRGLDKPIGEYGQASTIRFDATVADIDRSDLDKGWKVTSGDIESDYKITIDEDTIEEKENGLFGVSGEIQLTPARAGNDLKLTLVYSHTDNEKQKVYKDATANITFSINQKPLHVKKIKFEDKIYDGTPNVGIEAVIFNEDDIAENDKDNVAAKIEGMTFRLATAARDGKDNVEEGISYLSWKDETEGSEKPAGTISLADPDMNNNYLIVKGEEIGEKGFTCEIKRRPIYLQVSNGTREYGTDLPKDQKNVKLLDYNEEQKSGVVEGDIVEDNITVVDTNPDALVQGSAYADILKPAILDENFENGKIIDGTDSEVNSANQNYCYKIGADDQGKPLFGDLIITERTLTKNNIHDFVSYEGDIFTDPENSNLWVRGNLAGDSTAYGIWVKINSEDSLFDAIKITGVSPFASEESMESEYDKEIGDNRKISFNTSEKIDSIGQKITFELYKDNVPCSRSYTQTAFVDTKAPTVTFEDLVGENTPLDSIISAVSFGNYKNTLFSVPVTVNDEGSGKRNFDQVVLNVTDDISKEELCVVLNGLSEENWDNGTEGIPIPVGKGDKEKTVEGYYVAAVRTYDNLGNTLIYASNGIVIENKEPSVQFPVDLDYRYNQEYLETAIEIDNITVTDYAVKGTEYVSSGINNIQYVIYQGTEENKISEATVYSTEDDTQYSYERLRDKNGEPLKIAFKGVLDIKNLGDKEKLLADHNDVYLKVMATDNSGKTVSAVQQLTIDLTSPEVDVQYTNESNTSVHNGTYFNGNRKAVLAIKDRNIIPGQIYFNLTLTDKKLNETYTLDSASIEQLRELTDVTPKHQNVFSSVSTEMKDLGDGAQQMDIVFVFNGEDRYEVNFSCVDGLGNRNDSVSYSTDVTEAANNVFTIDKTSPVIKQIYTAGGTEIALQLGEPYYVQSPVYYTTYIDEHNFAGEGLDFGAVSQTEISRNTDGAWNSDDLMQDSSQWAENSVNGITEQWKYTFTFEAQGAYRHFFEYKDLAGNPAIYVDAKGNEISNTDALFTIDWTRGTGSVSINGFGFWETFLHNITFGLFNPGSVDVEMNAEDYTSPLYAVQYFRTPDPMSLEQLENYDWSNTNYMDPSEDGYKAHGAFTVNPDEQFVVYMKITDYANNVSYFSSDGMIVDSAKPAPVVTITNLSQSQNGIFNEDVTLQIDVEDPYAGDTYSGLERVWYTVSASGNVNTSETVELLNNSSRRVQSNQTFSQVITVPANVYNSNEVKVQAFAVDFSGNQGESEITQMKIDVTNPTISVSWDLNNPLNGSYYKDTRTATVTVTDRNFDPNNVRFSITNTDGTEASIGGWSIGSDIGVSDSATSTCQVAFPADGDYTFTLGCTDLAGNSTEYGQTDAFTIDKTVPEISVSYDNNSAENGNYYNEARTATVTVREHNFNATDVKAAITASLEGRGTSAPPISGFSGSGDVHTATVTYRTDGDYTFDVEYTDMAGNAAADYTPDDFTVDLTEPEIEITDVADKSANNDVVSPSVKATDVNYDSRNVTATITGANNGKVDIGNVVSAIENGQTIKFNDFARQEKMDDLYTLTAKAVDMAGNEKEDSILFSVNRYGSVYVLDDDTKDWLSTKDYTYINEEKEVGVVEYNVDTIKESQITVNRDGELTNLKAKEDYKVTSAVTEAQWKENHYVLDAENFETEGNYFVIFSTQDEAGNVMNNTSVKKNNQNLPIEFAVDKTAPTVVISGVEDRGSYRSAERTMTVDAKDNLALDEVTVSVDGESQTYKAEELAEIDGIIDVVIASANNFQEIEVTASDAAGNVLGQKQINGKGRPVIVRILVTPNALIQYYMNKPLFFGTIMGAVVIAGMIIFLIERKRKNIRQTEPDAKGL